MGREVKEIRIDGKQSDWYESAIFVLKPRMMEEHLPTNLIDYAEQIIERQMKLSPAQSMGTKVAQPTSYKKNQTSSNTHWIDLFLGMSLMALVVVSIMYVVL